MKTTFDKKDNKRRRRTDREVLRLLTAAWKAAEKWVREQPPAIDREAGRARARAVRDWIADADVQMPDAERKILAHAVQVAIDKGTDRPTLPRKQMLAATGLGLTALRLSLARLESARLLVLEVRGHRRGPNAHESTPARANAYRLAGDQAMSTYQYPKNGSVVPQALLCSAPGDNVPGAPSLFCSAPELDASLEGPTVVSFSAVFTASDAETMRAGLHTLLASGVRITEQPSATDRLPDNVVPLRQDDVVRRSAS